MSKKKKHGHFVGLTNRTLRTTAWRTLSAKAKILYLHLKGKYNGSNNGDISLHYSELEDIEGLKSSSTQCNAFRELEQKGWAKRTQHGGMFRYQNKYELTWKYDDMD